MADAIESVAVPIASGALLLLSVEKPKPLRDLDGHLVLAGLDVPLVLVVDRSHAREFAELPVQVLPLSRPVLQDARAIMTQLARRSEGPPIAKVLTLDESGVQPAAELRALLGLPGLQPAQAHRFRDKVAMKQAVRAAGVRVPRFAKRADIVSVSALLADHGKVVVKQRDGSGSRGVAVLRSRDEFDQWRSSVARADLYQAEEFVEGTMYSINPVVVDGRVAACCSLYNRPGMSDVDYTRGAPFAHFAVPEGALHDRFVAFAQQVALALDLQAGIMHLECFLTPKDEIVFCEVAARPGGGGVLRVVERELGIHYGRAAIMLEAGCVGDALRSTHIGRRDGQACFLGFRSGSQGFIKAIATRNDFPEPWIDRVRFLAGTGSFVAPSAHCTDFIAQIDFRAASIEEMHVRVDLLHRRFDSHFVLGK